MLYRAFGYIVQSQQAEVTVFFEHLGPPFADRASSRLRFALAAVWRAPTESVDFYNLYSEQDLLGDHAFGPAETGDARLLETGAGGEDPIHYAQPESTLLLLRPDALARLVNAQRLAARIHKSNRARPRRIGQEDYLHQPLVAA